MNLDELALKHGTDKASSHHDYCRIYEPLFSPWRKAEMDMLEIGVQTGASVKLWLDYFESANIYGVDTDDDFKSADKRYHFIKGDQGSRAFWRTLPKDLCFDLIIDDGSHMVSDVITSFENLWCRVRSGGIYVIEDVFTFFHPYFDKRSVGPNWLTSFISAVNLDGKYFYGNPGTIPPDKPLTDLEHDLEWVQLHKGLVILKKRVGVPNLK